MLNLDALNGHGIGGHKYMCTGNQDYSSRLGGLNEIEAHEGSNMEVDSHSKVDGS